MSPLSDPAAFVPSGGSATGLSDPKDFVSRVKRAVFSRVPDTPRQPEGGVVRPEEPLERDPAGDPVSMLLSLLPAGRAIKVADAATEALPWLARAAARGAIAGGTAGAIDRSVPNPTLTNNPVVGAVGGAAGGAVLGPPMEVAFGAPARVAALLRARGAAPAASAVEAGAADLVPHSGPVAEPTVVEGRPTPITEPAAAPTAPIAEAAATEGAAARAAAPDIPAALPEPPPASVPVAEEVPALEGAAAAAPERTPMADELPGEGMRAGPATGEVRSRDLETGTKFLGLEESDPRLEHVNRTLESLGLGEYRARHWDEVGQLAEELQINKEALLANQSARPLSDREVAATGNIVKQSLTTFRDATARLEDPNLTPKDRESLQRVIGEATKDIESALRIRVRGLTESARAVAAARMLANATTDPAFWLQRAVKVSGKPLTPEVIQAITDACSRNDRASIAMLIGNLRNAGWSEKVTTLVKAGMLTNPGTDVRNMLGNASSMTMNLAADVPADMLDMVMSRFTGIRSTSFSARRATALMRGAAAGARKAGQTIARGATDEEIGARWDFNHGRTFETKALELYKEAVFRRLQAEDYLFREPQYASAIAEMAEVEAKNAHLTGQAFLDKVEELIKTPTPRMIQAAEETAQYRTFNNPNRVAEALQMAERHVGPAGELAGTAVMAFKRTPLNVMGMIFDFTPFGVPNSVFRYMTSKSMDPVLRQRYLVHGIGRTVAGTTLASLGFALAQAGLAVGALPKDAAERRARTETGAGEMSIRVGDRWVSVNNNAPFANVLFAGVDTYEAFRDNPSAWDVYGDATSSTVKGAMGQTFVKGVRGASDFASDPKQNYNDFFEGIVGMLVPSLLGAVARGTDPYERQVNNPAEAVMARIPGLREKLQPQIDAEGNERPQQAGLASQILSPIRSQQIPTDRLRRMYSAIEWAPTVPRGTKIRGIDVTPAEMTQFAREVGKLRAQYMNDELGNADPDKPMSEDERDAMRKRLEAASNRAVNEVAKQWKERLTNRNQEE